MRMPKAPIAPDDEFGISDVSALIRPSGEFSRQKVVMSAARTHYWSQ